MPKLSKYKQIVELHPRWVSIKKLGSLSWLHQLRRDDITTKDFRKELVKEIKEAKQEWKEYIKNYKVRGYYKSRNWKV